MEENKKQNVGSEIADELLESVTGGSVCKHLAGDVVHYKGICVDCYNNNCLRIIKTTNEPPKVCPFCHGTNISYSVVKS